jgi:hypothetical protein
MNIYRKWGVGALLALLLLSTYNGAQPGLYAYALQFSRVSRERRLKKKRMALLWNGLTVPDRGGKALNTKKQSLISEFCLL